MRPIDADWIDKRMDELAVYDWARQLIRSWLDIAPTIDAVPVVHGEWIAEKYPFCKCSACGKSIKIDYDYILPVNYCPNCGAKMDGKEKTDE